jgi:hypothetical protein
MSLQDFIDKQRETVRAQGIMQAARDAATEATIKAAGPYATYRATPIWESDADVVLVLDSCRYDLWEYTVGAHNSLVRSMDQFGDGMPIASNTTSIWSVGSASPEWISNTFANEHREHWENAAYVTANPFSAKEGHEIRHLDPDVVPLVDRGLGYLDEVWRDAWPMNDDLPTVDPATLTERALWAWNERRRLDVDTIVVHYMQPHIPFRGQSEWTDGWDLSGFGTGGGHGKDDWLKLRDGEIGETEFWDAYRDNLRWVLEEVRRWYELTDANILVTSDHGNGKGEWGQWGHPPGSANPAIRKVPWCELSGVGGQSVDPSLARQPPGSGPENTDVEEQLGALGYR